MDVALETLLNPQKSFACSEGTEGCLRTVLGCCSPSLRLSAEEAAEAEVSQLGIVFVLAVVEIDCCQPVAEFVEGDEAVGMLLVGLQSLTDQFELPADKLCHQQESFQSERSLK